MNIQLQPIPAPTPRQQERLLAVWEASVRATHDFLVEADILRLRPQVLAGIAAAGALVCAVNERAEILAFLATSHQHIEMLFVHPASRGAGVGRQLIRHAVDQLGCRTVDVNEQNTQGVGFYERMGFRVSRRSPTDDQGAPFPILHMRLDAPRSANSV